jgi:hypothetical protein
MTSKVSKQRDVASQLVKFFDKLGIEITQSQYKEETTVTVYDRRVENDFVAYTLTFLEDGSQLRVESFQIMTPKVQEVLSDGVAEVFVISLGLNKVLFSLSWKLKTPLVLEISYSTLKALVENPAKLFFNTKINDKSYVDPLFIKTFNNWVEEYTMPLTEEQDKMMRKLITELGKQDLNSTVLMV